MPPARTSPLRTVVCRLVLVWLSMLSVAGMSALAFPTHAQAADREEARARKILLGRHDPARVALLRSIPRDFQSRNAALPVIAESLKSLEDDGRFDRLEKQGQPDLPSGVRMMIEFVGTIDRPEATQALVDLLDCGRVSWAMATIQTLCKHQHHAALDDVIALIDSEYFDASYGFRFTLARGLKEMKHPDAWDALAKLFDRVDGQLAHRLDEEFQKVTTDEFLGDEKRFLTWRGRVGLTPQKEPAEEGGLAKAVAILNQGKTAEMPLPEKMNLQPSQSGASYAREKRLKPSHYYGIQIHAKRLLFVIDRSGSMRTVVSGQTRIQRAKQELIAAISGLDQQVEFGILVFDDQVRPWREELVQASDDNKLNAIRFVEYLSAGRATNTYGALRQSLDFDPQLESVFLLTDGKPTTGQIVNQSAILLDILHRNETHNVTINTVAVAVDPFMATFLRNLAEPSNGEFREVK